MKNSKVWYIRGASKGIGRSFIKSLLAQGQKVVATRDLSSLDPIQDGSFLPLQVDLINGKSIAQSITNTLEKFGQIDVVVNNAGYGISGSLEELSDEEINANFNINFFAPVKVIQHVLPHFRRQNSGFVINITSIASFAPGAGWSIYAAAKSALSGLSAALQNDLSPLGNM